MKVAVLALMAVLAFAVPATAGADDAQGPACADVIGGGGNFVNGNLAFSAFLLEPACSFGPEGLVTYTLEVYDNVDGSGPLVELTNYQLASGGSTLVYSASGLEDDGTVCVVLTTRIARHVVDSAHPNDRACLLVTSSSPGFGFH